jgi:prevent-host-death family protein
MKIANIAAAKNHFSRLIEQVKQGETVVITDRNRPVAQIRPLDAGEAPLETLHASGLLNPPQTTLNVAAFLAAARPVAPASGSLRDAILEEREGGR